MMPLLSLQYLGHPCGTSLRIEDYNVLLAKSSEERCSTGFVVKNK